MCCADRDEHLQFAKTRALQILDTGDIAGACASMTSDLLKHQFWCDEKFTMVFALGLLEIKNGAAAMRHWIEGFA